MKEFTDLDFAKSYHGHLGPFLVIGIKMGNRAIRELKPESCFQLHANVHCPENPPPSCVIDGIQLSSGCTMGKRNIAHSPTSGEVKVVFTNKNTGQSVEIELKDEFQQRATEVLKSAGEEEASMLCWNSADDDMFIVQHLPNTCRTQ